MKMKILRCFETSKTSSALARPYTREDVKVVNSAVGTAGVANALCELLCVEVGGRNCSGGVCLECVTAIDVQCVLKDVTAIGVQCVLRDVTAIGVQCVLRDFTVIGGQCVLRDVTAIGVQFCH